MARRKEGLGDRHKKILEVLEHYQDNVGYPPSIREIGREADISSTSVVNYYLDQLEEKGYIERDRRVSRGMRLIKTVSGKVKAAVDGIGNGSITHGCDRDHKIRARFPDTAILVEVTKRDMLVRRVIP